MSFFSGRRQNENDSESDNDKQQSSHIGFDTVLSASTTLDGTLKSEGNIRLDGIFSGKLDITGNVLVGETAEINADIEARNISIAGIVRGNVIGNKVQLLRTGRIWGDIQSNSLTTEEGAFIEGKIAMNAVSVAHKSEIDDNSEMDIASDVIDDETIASVEEHLDQTQPNLDDDADATVDVDEIE